MKRAKLRAAVTATLVAWTAVANAAPVLSILPGPSIFGPPGSTVGWGYQIVNDTANWLESLNLAADVFTNGTPNAIFDFPLVAPNSTLVVPFSQTASGACAVPDCGLFEFTWDVGAPVGASNAGVFAITGEFFDANPLTDPNAIDLGPAPDLTSAYSITAINGGTTPVPEPTSWLLVLSALGALGASRRSR